LTREQKYTEQLKELGIYQEAFAPAIKDLAMMEREVQKMVKEWKAEGSPPGTKLQLTISQYRRDISARRDDLGLTPKGLNRLKRTAADKEPAPAGKLTVLDKLLAQREA